MTTLKKTTAPFLALALAAACGSSSQSTPPPRTVATTQTAQPVAPVETQPVCEEEWVHMPVRIGFPTGGTEMDAQSRMVLEQVVRTAQTRDDILRVRVEGHTDSCGNEQNNMMLSEQRAMTVANELVTMGVPREILETQGFGSTVPMAEPDCSQRLDAQVNRRVEFTILTCRNDV